LTVRQQHLWGSAKPFWREINFASIALDRFIKLRIAEATPNVNNVKGNTILLFAMPTNTPTERKQTL